MYCQFEQGQVNTANMTSLRVCEWVCLLSIKQAVHVGRRWQGSDSQTLARSHTPTHWLHVCMTLLPKVGLVYHKAPKITKRFLYTIKSPSESCFNNFLHLRFW